jgi:microcystin degradation protein MlrC
MPESGRVNRRFRIAAAQISHETNRFSAVPTDLAAFQAAGIAYGQDAITQGRGTNTAFGGFATGAERHGGLDGVLLALHGAMVTTRDSDGDGFLLELVRRTVGPNIPIVATLDLHANISDRMVAAADVLIGYDTYPHVDMAARADEACDVLHRLLTGDVTPTPFLAAPPMLPTSQRMTTAQDPMRALIALAHDAERDPRVINVTVTGGFPPADVPEAGLRVLVTTAGDGALAETIARSIAAEAWRRRDGFLGGVSSQSDVIAVIQQSKRAETKPIVVVDIGDNPWTGSPGDSVEILRLLLRCRVERSAIALVMDPAAVRAAQEEGIGKQITAELGGKTDDLHGAPLLVDAEVRSFSDGTYVNEGPMMAGLRVDLGPAAVLRCRLSGEPAAATDVDVLVTSRAETPIDLNVFRAHGIEPTTLRVIGLKGKGHFRAAFEPIASQVLLFEGPGISGADLTRLPFKHLRRPIWPLDPIEGGYSGQA